MSDAINSAEMIDIEVACALPERQEIVSLKVAEGTTLAEAVDLAGILERFPEMSLDPAMVGIFSVKATLTTVLKDGDRVELYRPLIADPKDARRQRASEDKS